MIIRSLLPFLAKYTRTSYSLEELKKRPEELNPNKLETYLSEEDFQVSLIIMRNVHALD